MSSSRFLSILLLALQPILGIAAEPEANFQSLFDGKTLNGWEHSGNWAVEDGAIARVAKGGSLTYKTAKVPDDFELRFDWKVSKGCNSGVYYRPGQYEYQLLDNANSPYGENPRQSAAALYFCVAPTKDVVRPFNEWNEGRILCKGTVIQHWLNGEKVVDLDYADPRWADAIKLVSYRGTDLSKRGGSLWLQDHGAPVWFKNLRWRTIPTGEELKSENLTPMPVPEAALKKEQERIQELLKPKPAKKSAGTGSSKWQHQELKRFKADEAKQGVAVDSEHFYAITNAAIGKYRKDTGERVAQWEDEKGGRIKHLNAGLVLGDKLYCAHSNFPEIPTESSIEIWDAKTMKHLETRHIEGGDGSLTWIDQHKDKWFACFAQYAKTGDPGQTRLVQYDATWKKLHEWKFPKDLIAKFGSNSSSGGSFGPGGHLFITGHDAQELYVLSVPKSGAALEWQTTITISAHGQAFAWDRGEAGLLYSIDRKPREVIVSRITSK